MIKIKFNQSIHPFQDQQRLFEKNLDILEMLLGMEPRVENVRETLYSMEIVLKFCELFQSGTIESLRIDGEEKDYPFTKEGPADLFAEIFARIESEWGQVMETQEGWRSYLTEKNPLAKILFAQYIFTRWHAFREVYI